MENNKKPKNKNSLNTGSTRDLDYPEFWHNWDPSASLSKNFESLLTSLTISKVEFVTNINMPKAGVLRNNYVVQSVILKGSPAYIQLRLKQTLSSVVKKLESFTKGIEGEYTKIIELSQCKWLLKHWYHYTKMDVEGLYHPDTKYTLRFKDDKYMELPYSRFTFSEQAEDHMHIHHRIRLDFLDVIQACIDLQLDKVKYIALEREKFPFIKDQEKEGQLLEVWIGLKKNDFLGFLKGTSNELWNEARLRDRFFSIFNLKCENYNDAHKSLKTRKEKGQFSYKLHETMKKYK